MNWSTVFSGVHAKLDAEFSAAPVAYPNENFLAPDGAPWLYVEVLPLDGSGPLHGSDDHSHGLEEGLIAVHAFVPSGTGATAGFDLTEQISAILRRFTPAPGIQLGRPIPGGAGSSDDEGNWFRTSVAFPVIVITE